MKIVFLACFSLTCILNAYSQENDYSYVDNSILTIPKNFTNTTSAIAAFIQSNFKKEKEKLRAIHRWITYNISYDTDSMLVFNWGAYPEKKVTAALRRRKGVCENFTAIFSEIAIKCGLQSFIVSGYTKQLGRIDRVGHTWCAVNADGEWLFCDPTWDIGYAVNPNYFLIQPSLFIQSHMPFDPLWQLLDHPVSKDAFYTGNFHSRIEQPVYNFADSVKAFLKQTELQQLESTITRIKHDPLVNDLEKNNLDFIEMLVGLFYEDRDVALYNGAVDDLNKATAILNNFIEYRNSQFIPVKPDNEISNLLAPVDIKIESAHRKLDQLDQSAVNSQYNTYSIRERLKNFKTTVQAQKVFLEKYLSTPESERKKIF